MPESYADKIKVKNTKLNFYNVSSYVHEYVIT